jgi:uncharacterized protein (DUF3084 family)
MPTSTSTTVFELLQRLRSLNAERALAIVEGLGTDAAYMADLDDEIAMYRQAYAGLAVTEIATFRGQLSGPLNG